MKFELELNIELLGGFLATRILGISISPISLEA